MALAAELTDGESAACGLVDRLLPVTFFLDVSLSACHRHPRSVRMTRAPTHTSSIAGEYHLKSLPGKDGFTGRVPTNSDFLTNPDIEPLAED